MLQGSKAKISNWICTKFDLIQKTEIVIFFSITFINLIYSICFKDIHKYFNLPFNSIKDVSWEVILSLFVTNVYELSLWLIAVYPFLFIMKIVIFVIKKQFAIRRFLILLCVLVSYFLLLFSTFLLYIADKYKNNPF